MDQEVMMAGMKSTYAVLQFDIFWNHDVSEIVVKSNTWSNVQNEVTL